MMESHILIEIKGEGDIVMARRKGRDLAASVGFRAVDQSRLATAISELARNILHYARSGEIHILTLEEPRGRGVEVIARDSGPGIADVDQAMRDGYTSGQGLGIGLPGTRRLVDEMEVESQLGQGTVVRIRKWLR